jgi:hypothetical protein
MPQIANSLNGLSYLTQPGGPLSSAAAWMSPAELKSASPHDLVTLSMAALQAQEVNGLFGISQSRNTLPALPIAFAPPTDLLPGVAPADLLNATPQEQAAVNNQALLLQQVQGLFGEPTSVTGKTNLFG